MKDKIDIIKIAKGNPAAALMVFAALIVIFMYIAVFAPSANKLRAKHLEYLAFEGQAAGARDLIEMCYRINLEYGNRILISEQQASVGIEEFTRHCKSLGINFISMKPQNIIKQEGAPYKILPIELSFEANGEQFLEFIGSIDGLKKAIVTVKSFNITPDKDDREKLRASMTVNIYLSLEQGDQEGI